MMKVPEPDVHRSLRKRDASTATICESPPAAPAPASLRSFFPALVTETMPRLRHSLPDVMVPTLRFRGGGGGSGRGPGALSRPPTGRPSATPTGCECCNVCQHDTNMSCACNAGFRGGGSGGGLSADKGSKDTEIGCSCYDADEPDSVSIIQDDSEEPYEEPRWTSAEEGGRRNDQPRRTFAPESVGPDEYPDDGPPRVSRRPFAQPRGPPDNFSDEESYHEPRKTFRADPDNPQRASRADPDERGQRIDSEGDAFPSQSQKSYAAKGRDSGSNQGSLGSERSRRREEPPPPLPEEAPFPEPRKTYRPRRPDDSEEDADFPPPRPQKSFSGDRGRRDFPDDFVTECRSCCGRQRPPPMRPVDSWEDLNDDGSRGRKNKVSEFRVRSSAEDLRERNSRGVFPRSSRPEFSGRKRSGDDFYDERSFEDLPGERRSRADFPDRRSRADFPDRRSRADFPDERRTRSDFPDERRSRTPFPEERGSRYDFPDERKTRSDFPDERRSRTPFPEDRGSRYDFSDERKTRSDFPDERRSRTPFPEERGSRYDFPDERRTRSDVPGERSRTDFPGERRSRAPFPEERGSRYDFPDERRSRPVFPVERSRADFPDERKSRADFPRGRSSRGDIPRDRSSDGVYGGRDSDDYRARGSAGDMRARGSRYGREERDGCPPDCTGLSSSKSKKSRESVSSKVKRSLATGSGGKGDVAVLPCTYTPKCERDGECPEITGISKCNEVPRKQRSILQSEDSSEGRSRPSRDPGTFCSPVCDHTRGKKRKKRNECCRKLFSCCMPRKGETRKESIERKIRETPYRVKRVEPRGFSRLVKQ